MLVVTQLWDEYIVGSVILEANGLVSSPHGSSTGLSGVIKVLIS